jgi:hypothetical protein
MLKGLWGDNMKNDMKRLILGALKSLERDEAQPRPKSRQGKKAVVGHFDPAFAWQLKKLAVDRGTTVQKMLEESLHDLFEKYHLPKIN